MLFGPVPRCSAAGAAVAIEQFSLFDIKHLRFIDGPLMMAIPTECISLVTYTGLGLFKREDI